MAGKKAAIVPCKVCGWDVEFDEVRRCIEGTVARLGDVPDDVQSRLATLSVALKMADSYFRQLVESLARHGLDLSDE